MVSKLKSDTARANGAKSRGPKSPATREKASHNSLRHGFTARNTVLLECENPDLYEELRNQYIAAYQPASPVENDLVEEMVVARWRIQRLWTIETALIDREMRRRQPDQSDAADPGIHLAVAFRALADESNSLALISRYESRLHRIHQRAYRTLRELRQDRQPSTAPEPVVKNCQTNPPSPTTPPTPIQNRDLSHDREGAEDRHQSMPLDSNQRGAFQPSPSLTATPKGPTNPITYPLAANVLCD